MDLAETHYMPHAVDNKDIPFADDLKKLKSESTTPIFGHDIRGFLEQNYPEIDFVGVGSESVVIGDPDNPDRVVAYRHGETKRETPDLEYLGKYHMHNALHILYPQYFPEIHAASDKARQTTRERIYPDKKLDQDIKDNMYPRDFDKMIRGVEDEIKTSTGINVRLDAGSKDNVLYDKNGNMKYVDLISNDTTNFNFDKKKIIEHIKATGGRDEETLRRLKKNYFCS